MPPHVRRGWRRIGLGSIAVIDANTPGAGTRIGTRRKRNSDYGPFGHEMQKASASDAPHVSYPLTHQIQITQSSQGMDINSRRPTVVLLCHQLKCATTALRDLIPDAASCPREDYILWETSLPHVCDMLLNSAPCVYVSVKKQQHRLDLTKKPIQP
jgi:hypothetical protein